jgi:hypothetical protein
MPYPTPFTQGQLTTSQGSSSTILAGEINENNTLPTMALWPFHQALTTLKSMIDNGIIAFLSQLLGKRERPL